MCLYKTLRKNPKFKANNKNGGIIPKKKSELLTYIETPCGKCIECKKANAREWAIRLYEENKAQQKKGIKGNFVTWTFSDDALIELNKIVIKNQEQKLNERGNTLKEIERIKEKMKGYKLENESVIIAVKRWRELWRYYENKKPKKEREKLTYWIATELGQTKTERIHIHGIVWTNEKEKIQKCWKYGKIQIGNKNDINGKVKNYINDSSINYITKYIHKTDKKHPNYKSIKLASHGIGKAYLMTYNATLNKYNGELTKREYRKKDGTKTANPRYYRDKQYTEEQREELNIKYLEKGEKWIGGIKINTNTEQGLKEYKILLEEERRKNKKWGYGGHKTNEEIRKEKQEEEVKRNELKYEREWKKRAS